MTCSCDGGTACQQLFVTGAYDLTIAAVSDLTAPVAQHSLVPMHRSASTTRLCPAIFSGPGSASGTLILHGQASFCMLS